MSGKKSKLLLPKKAVGRKPICNEQYEDEVKRLREQGKTNEEIGAVLKIAPSRVSRIITKLIKNGKIDRRQPSEKRIGKYTKDFIENEIVRNPKATFSVWEVSYGLQIERHIIRRLIKNGEIPHLKRGRMILLDASSVEALQKHVVATLEKTCKVCKGKFKCRDRQDIARETCYSQTCFDKNRAKNKKTKPVEQLIREQLRQHVLPKDDVWVPLPQAAKRAGMSIMMLVRLNHKYVLKTRPDRSRIVQGKPVNLYSVSQMDVIRKTYEQHANQGGEN